MKTSHLTLGHHRSYDTPQEPSTELLAAVLRAFLFWTKNNGLSTYREEGAACSLGTPECRLVRSFAD